MNISLFDDKPKLDEIYFKHDILNRFGKLRIDEINNLIFYGMPTCGKTTKIYALLATIFDLKVYDIKNIEYNDDHKTMVYKASIYHIEIDPIILGSNEKLFISSFLKLYVETRNIGLDIPKIILVKNAELLSKNSQLSLRKIIEKSSITTRFIFEISNISGFSPAIISRCLLIKIKMPNIIEIKGCIKDYLNKKDIKITDNVIEHILDNTPYDLKKIFGHVFYYIHTKKYFKFLYYDKFNEILNHITNKKITFVGLQKIRDIINELYINLVSMDELMHFIFNKLCDIHKNKNDYIDALLKLTIKCDINLKKGNKDCIHLEHYIISIIDI